MACRYTVWTAEASLLDVWSVQAVSQIDPTASTATARDEIPGILNWIGIPPTIERLLRIMPEQPENHRQFR
jgi:hypothetical protein